MPPTENSAEKIEEIFKVVQEMKKSFKECNNQNENLKRELERTNQELRQIKEKMRKKEQWQKEKQELTLKIHEVEENIDKQKKNKKRNNIIIKNLKIENEIQKDVEDLIEGKLNMQANITESYSIKKRNNCSETTKLATEKNNNWKYKDVKRNQSVH
ncbi:hypothetical protein ILUMI_22193 [Ignelater luminosus]|uniref:Uncharacterized protein n=1 Tax=Ignelater luminosus TaxID=2038154 RepID=A0A8K0G314_IGNLU|nr:hypothetical protein ILUMI_22193 [Ignelater luminosus]